MTSDTDLYILAFITIYIAIGLASWMIISATHLPKNLLEFITVVLVWPYLWLMAILDLPFPITRNRSKRMEVVKTVIVFTIITLIVIALLYGITN